LELNAESLDFSSAIRQKGWMSAIQSEINSILKNRTWQIVDPITGKKPITAKWIFITKRNMNGGIDKFKARIVAREF